MAALPSVTGATGTLPSFGSARPDGAAATYHTVADGETIWDIAKHHGVSVEDIKAANGIGEAQVIQAGQVLKVPAYAEVAIAPTLSATPEPQAVALATPPQESWELPATVVEGEPLSEVETEPYTLTEFLAAQQAQQIASVADAEASPQTPEVDESDLMAAVTTPEPTAIALAQPLNRREASVLPSSVPDKAITKPEGSIVSGQEISAERQVAHRVSSGETIWSIAQAYDVDLDDLQALNGLSDPDFIVSGDELMIPVASAPMVESVIAEEATGQQSPALPYSMAAIEQKADPA
ncbi:MAG TPA: LysM peptidoglycan-binding domain-containing protein, partial [Candidatus Obscuribacterales bacterium]